MLVALSFVGIISSPGEEIAAPLAVVVDGGFVSWT